MKESDSLLSWLKDIYGWFVDSCSGPQEQKRTTQQALDDARNAFSTTWWTFLPLEREMVVDRLLAASCKSFALSTFDPNLLFYSYLRADVRAAAQQHQRLVNPHLEYERLRNLVQSISRNYDELPVVDPFEHGEHAEAADQWAADLLNPSGISSDKLSRMGSAYGYLLAMLTEIGKKVTGHAQNPGPMPAPSLLLPEADSLLEIAEHIAQTPAQRFEAFKSLFRSLTYLYSPTNVHNEAPPEVKEAQAKHMNTAYTANMHEYALEYFRTKLTAEQQQRAVSRARVVVLATCRGFHINHGLPDAESLTHELLLLLTGHLSDEERAAATRAAPLVARSLAHIASLREISDRKARRYYGTTAAEWEERQPW